jgi:hypothetical protein
LTSGRVVMVMRDRVRLPSLVLDRHTTAAPHGDRRLVTGIEPGGIT